MAGEDLNLRPSGYETYPFRLTGMVRTDRVGPIRPSTWDYATAPTLSCNPAIHKEFQIRASFSWKQMAPRGAEIFGSPLHSGSVSVMVA